MIPMDPKPPRSAHQVARSVRELPEPTPEAREASERLRSFILAEMGASEGKLSFARFMELALYAPGLGYYSGGSRKFGPEGDFVTAPEISPLFSRCLARQCRQVLDESGGSILEFGAGSGVMAADLLEELERLSCLPSRYLILEVSGELRQRQGELLSERVPHLMERIQWLDTLPVGFRGVILANEVLDALPVHRFRMVQGEPRELFVTRGREGFEWTEAAPEERLADRIEELLAELGPLEDGYESEISLAADDWIRSLGSLLEQGAVFLIDYGFPRREFYHSQRSGGTLMCHYRHRSHPDPLILAGLQDITAHVDFTAVAEAALSCGLTVSGFANQTSFLLANGLMELVAEFEEDPYRRMLVAGQVKKLTMPSEMGELFKVMALTRGVDVPLQGFLLRDDRFRL